MNIHPLFVHFPIALLTLYALCELLRFRRLQENVSWFWWKLGLLVFGTLGSFVAFHTGKMVVGSVSPADFPPLLKMHATFATLSVQLFFTLACLYIVSATSRGLMFQSVVPFLQRYPVSRTLWNALLFLKRLIVDSGFIVLFAIVGLVFISITGALGGAMVYGVDTDPFVRFIYNLLF